MGKINSGPPSSLLFEYDTNLIGDTNSDTEYADPENKEFIWPKNTFRIKLDNNAPTWADTFKFFVKETSNEYGLHGSR